MKHIRLLKDSVQRADLRLDRSWAEGKRRTDKSTAMAACTSKPVEACPGEFFGSLTWRKFRDVALWRWLADVRRLPMSFGMMAEVRRRDDEPV